jgi:uncharacterized NAD(P)/FAD-binding protein YdhS
MQQQHANQMALNNQMQQIQQENWNYTNFENQLKHLKNAGLSVGLMYGKGGAGGTTMGGASGGSAAMGQAPQNVMPQAMALLQQSLMQQSQIKLNEAQENKLNAEADKIRGAETENIKADTALKNVNTQLQQIEADVKKEFRFDEYLAQVNKLQSEARQELVKANVSEKTQDTQIKILDGKLLQIGLENILIKANTNLTNERIKQVGQDIINSINQTLAIQRNAYTNERNVWNNEWDTNIRKELGNRGIDVQEQGQILDLFKTLFTGSAIMSKEGTIINYGR